MDRAAFIDRRTSDAWTYGIEHRERLVRTFMDGDRLTVRPLLKDIVDILIEEIQGARLREDVLPLDRYAQTESAGGRLEVTVNSRIHLMEGVKHVNGVAHVAKWHESIHVDRDFRDLGQARVGEQASLPGLVAQLPALVACRGFHENLPAERKASEFFAETAGVAAAVCGEDLNQSPAYRYLVRRARQGGELGASGWSLLYSAAEFIGVNPSTLLKFLEHNGIAAAARRDSGNRLIGNVQLGLEER